MNLRIAILHAADTARIEAHLLRLSSDDRSLRFAAGLVTDETIRAYVARIRFDGDAFFGLLDDAGVLVGLAHGCTYAVDGRPRIEAAFSIDVAWRRNGFGTALMRSVETFAEQVGAESLLGICLARMARSRARRTRSMPPAALPRLAQRAGRTKVGRAPRAARSKPDRSARSLGRTVPDDAVPGGRQLFLDLLEFCGHPGAFAPKARAPGVRWPRSLALQADTCRPPRRIHDEGRLSRCRRHPLSPEAQRRVSTDADLRRPKPERQQSVCFWTSATNTSVRQSRPCQELS